MAKTLTDNWQIAEILTHNRHLYPPIQTLYTERKFSRYLTAEVGPLIIYIEWIFSRYLTAEIGPLTIYRVRDI